ncbi:MAG TPA: hypothetical protein VHG30_00150 [Microvirga sp.]|nr:hypothetical protein [Microvirga sp.]
MVRARMTRSSPPSRLRRRIQPGVALLVCGGAALLGAGALLGWRHGATISLGESVLAAIAWCF